ncbi:MAG: hypothetical protein DRQ89_12805 [Epsilonproteobacteria bacterium]|nr:MAG: hypothetical protein DRQ89_12805 [Campylobacterota bacterium]
MATISSGSYKKIADLSLFLKQTNGDELVLSDISQIISLRWTYLKNNWDFVKSLVEDRVEDYNEPDFLRIQIEDFTDFLEAQRSSTKNINPLSSNETLFRYYGVWDNIPINSIELTNQERDIVDAELLRVSNFNRKDFLDIRSQLEQQRDGIADNIGLTDPDYNSAVKRSPTDAQLSASITDLSVMQKIQDAIGSVDFVLANIFSLENNFIDPFALARSNANNPEIEIASYQSGNLVRLNQGESLQLLARRYLGDADKWIDIAIANGLKPPYIDEIGEKLFLIANGDKNQMNLANTNTMGELNIDKLNIDKLYINQIILLQSDTQKFPEQRKITNIKQVPVSGELVLELDGLSDLDRYRIDESAHIRVFKPNTINSSFFILIPSEEVLPDDRREEVPFFLQGKAEDEKKQKVDLAIDNDGDLIYTPAGDLQLSFGIANAIQAIKFKMQVKLGELRKHPTFGLVNVTGRKNIGIGAMRTLLTDSINEQISLDPRFDRIENLDVRYGVPSTGQGASVFAITMQVRLAGGTQVLPISFTVAA